MPTNERHELDYEIDDAVRVSTPQQMKAAADETRMNILNLLLERAATTSQLADALEKPKGTVGYHVKVLEDAGLIKVVRTAKVRAMTEKYYGRVGRTVAFETAPMKSDPQWFVQDALRGMRADRDDEGANFFTSRMVRIPEERAAEFSKRILELAEEFIALPRGGDTVYGLLAGIYPTDLPALPDEAKEEPTDE